MKKITLTLIAIVVLSNLCVAQTTTLTEDANGNLNTAKVVAATSVGQSFYIGHQIGAGYSNNLAIFSALTDNSNGTVNYFYDGQVNGIVNFSVRADGQGYFSGRLGIGTITPAGRLNIIGQTSGFGGQTIIDDNGNYIPTIAQYKWTGTGTSYYQNTIANSASSQGSMDFQLGAGVGAVIGSDAQTTRMTILPSGNVLIGKTSQTNTVYKLDVNGNIRGNSVVVNTTGADFVFNPTYKLPSLSDVGKYIALNHHLPDVPSAAAMQTNGLNLGDNQIKLLQKVEELTLYLIDKDKQLNDEKEANKKQQQQLDAQSNLLNNYNDQLQILKKRIEELEKRH